MGGDRSYITKSGFTLKCESFDHLHRKIQSDVMVSQFAGCNPC